MAPKGTLGTRASTTGLLKHPKNPGWHAETIDGTPGTLNGTLGIPLPPWEHQLGPQELLQHPRDARQHSRNLGNTEFHPWEPCSTPRTPAAPQNPSTSPRPQGPCTPGDTVPAPSNLKGSVPAPTEDLGPKRPVPAPHVCVGTLCWHPAPLGTQCQHSGGY